MGSVSYLHTPSWAENPSPATPERKTLSLDSKAIETRMKQDVFDILAFLTGFLDLSIQDHRRADTKLKRRGLDAIVRRMHGKHTKSIALRILQNNPAHPQAVDVMLLTEELIRCLRNIRDPDTVTTINTMIDRWWNENGTGLDVVHIDSPELEALKGLARARNAVVNTSSTIARVRERHEAALADIDG